LIGRDGFLYRVVDTIEQFGQARDLKDLEWLGLQAADSHPTAPVVDASAAHRDVANCLARDEINVFEVENDIRSEFDVGAQLPDYFTSGDGVQTRGFGLDDGHGIGMRVGSHRQVPCHGTVKSRE